MNGVIADEFIHIFLDSDTPLDLPLVFLGLCLATWLACRRSRAHALLAAALALFVYKSGERYVHPFVENSTRLALQDAESVAVTCAYGLLVTYIIWGCVSTNSGGKQTVSRR
jgi:hypothetical protein